MILAFALLAGTVLVAVLLPRQLHRMATSRVEPATVILWWLTSSLGVILTAAAGVLLIVLPGHGPARWVLDWIHNCWAAMRHGDVPQLDDVAGAAGVLVALAVLLRAGFAAARRQRLARRTHQRQLGLLRLAGRATPGAIPIYWLDHDQPLAYSVAGRPAVIVATRGLAEQLSDDQLGAVLAHEHAHLRGRHQLLLGMAQALAWALPVLPLLRQLPVAVKTLVEMAADHAAARVWGADAVRTALLRVGACHVPPGALAIADTEVGQRIARLGSHEEPRPLARRLTVLATVPSAVILPTATAFGLLFLTELVSCPLLPA